MDRNGCYSCQPDPEKASRDEAAEREILDKLKASLTEADLAELARATHELRLKQETPDPPEALKSVPSLSLQDIPKKPIQVPIEVIVNLYISFLENVRAFFWFRYSLNMPSKIVDWGYQWGTGIEARPLHQ